MRVLVSAAVAAFAAAACVQITDEPAAPAFALPADASDLGRWGSEPEYALSTEFDVMLTDYVRLRSVSGAVDELQARGFECLINRRFDADCRKELVSSACDHVWTAGLESQSPNGRVIASAQGRFERDCGGGG